jgi:RecA/RadA recombinase
LAEFRSTSTFKNDEARIVQARLRALDTALAGRDQIFFATISNELREWAKGQAFVKHMETAADLYNRKDVAQAYAEVSKMSMEIDRIDGVALNARILSAGTRVYMERAERMAQADKILSYGVSYLDEATGGILPNDIVLIGAKTGVGKTQIAVTIAAHNSMQGKRVAFFALEAEPNEMERRLKFALLSRLHSIQSPNAPGLRYRDWRQARMEPEVAPYEDKSNAFVEKAYANIRTIYKGWGDYDIKKLENDIVRISETVDLVIVDHLHYIDTEGVDTNREMKECLQVLRDLALFLGKPIVLLAHLRKNQGGRKNAPLVPDNEDFHGSSDITKICTQAIMLAPCYDGQTMFPSGLVPKVFCYDNGTPMPLWATYMRLTKCRIDGSATRYCGISFYNDVTGSYQQEYAIGHLTSADAVWMPEDAKYKPTWAKSATIHMNSSNE